MPFGAGFSWYKPKNKIIMGKTINNERVVQTEIRIDELINSNAGLKAMSQALSNEHQQNDFEYAKEMLLENRVWKKRKNVRSNNLKVGKVYLMTKRNISDQVNYKQDTMAVRFLGVRNTDINETCKFVGFNIPVSKLDAEDNDANISYEYVFEMFYSNIKGECNEMEPSEFGAYNWKGSLAIGSGAINVSFYEVSKKGFFDLLLKDNK